jgi:hypothetical protein
MRAAQIFEPATPIKIREPRNLHLGRVLAVVLLAAIGFGAYRVVTVKSPRAAATAASTVRPAVKPTAVAKPLIHKAALPKHEAVIRLTAKSVCWVGLNSPTGKSLYQGDVQAGKTMTWDEKNPVSLVIGNPAGVELTVNGKPEQMNTTQVVTLSINPLSKTPVKVG